MGRLAPRPALPRTHVGKAGVLTRPPPDPRWEGWRPHPPAACVRLVLILHENQKKQKQKKHPSLRLVLILYENQKNKKNSKIIIAVYV